MSTWKHELLAATPMWQHNERGTSCSSSLVTPPHRQGEKKAPTASPAHNTARVKVVQAFRSHPNLHGPSHGRFLEDKGREERCWSAPPKTCSPTLQSAVRNMKALESRSIRTPALAPPPRSVRAHMGAHAPTHASLTALSPQHTA